MDAFPSDPARQDSPWLTCPKAISKSLRTILGKAYFRAFEGVNSGGLVGAYWVRKLRDIDPKTCLVENLADAGKIAVPHITHAIERDLLFPYLRGRDVKKWHGKESCLYLLAYDAASRKCINESTMRRAFPKAYDYLLNFKKLLLARKTAPLRQQMTAGPFYPVLGVGPHTVAKWKVIFKDLTELFQCCVIGPEDSSIADKPLLADYTLRLIPADSEAEAHYLAALLNSAPCVAALYFTSTGVQTQRYHAGDAEKIAITKFVGTPIQQELSQMSKSCHTRARNGQLDVLSNLEKELDARAAEYWCISPKKLKGIEQALTLVNASDAAVQDEVGEE